jgi:hypothetical protein
LGEDVAQEVDPAALPGGAEQHRLDGGFQAGVGVGDDQLHPVQAAGLQRAQERGPERAVLAVADVEAEYLSAPVGRHAGGHHDRLRDDSVVDAGLAVGGVEEHVAKRLRGQAAVAEGGDLDVELAANPGHLRLGDAAVRAEGFDQVVDLPRRRAVQVGLHDHREQRLIDPPAPLQQAREERPGPQLRDLQLQIPSRRADRLRAMPIALRRASLSPFVRAGADH